MNRRPRVTPKKELPSDEKSVRPVSLPCFETMITSSKEFPINCSTKESIGESYTHRQSAMFALSNFDISRVRVERASQTKRIDSSGGEAGDSDVDGDEEGSNKAYPKKRLISIAKNLGISNLSQNKPQLVEAIRLKWAQLKPDPL